MKSLPPIRGQRAAESCLRDYAKKRCRGGEIDTRYRPDSGIAADISTELPELLDDLAQRFRKGERVDH